MGQERGDEETSGEENYQSRPRRDRGEAGKSKQRGIGTVRAEGVSSRRRTASIVDCPIISVETIQREPRDQNV
jgi:imidazolonepropionase-like amidohydrolase